MGINAQSVTVTPPQINAVNNALLSVNPGAGTFVTQGY